MKNIAGMVLLWTVLALLPALTTGRLLNRGSTGLLEFDLENRVSTNAQLMSDIVQNMSINSAFDAVRGLAGGEDQTTLEKISRSLTKKTQLRTGGIEQARDMLNNMLKEAQIKKDAEETKCSNFEMSQLAIIEETNIDISNAKTEAASAQAQIIVAQKGIGHFNALLPKLVAQLNLFTLSCNTNLFALAKMIKSITNDLRIMGNLVALTSCDGGRTLIQLARCKHPRKGTSFITFQNTTLRNAMAQLGHESVKIVQEALTEIDKAAPPASDSKPPSRRKQNNKCSIASNPNCDRMKDKFLEIVTDIDSRRSDLLMQQARLTQKCEFGIKNLKSQIDDARGSLAIETGNLATATSVLNGAIEFHRMKAKEYRQFTLEYKKQMKICHTAITNLISEICGIRKIRTEMYKMENVADIPRDCEVSDWSAGKCSVECGTGEQVLTRMVTIQKAFFGRDCPGLHMVRSCNEEPCPIDCVMGDWSGWGACTAACGGGVEERSRSVVTPAKNGGTPCESETEAHSCNVDDCDKPCVLSDWSEWSACSKKCDRGMNTRKKKVVQAAVGEGECWARRDPQRIEFKFCNELPCKEENIIPKCDAKLDLVLLLDGSGSLGTEGWKQTKVAAEKLVSSLKGDEDNVKVSAILFSGPSTKVAYDKCVGGSSDPPPDMAKDCGITLITHFTTDMPDLKTKIEELKWPKSTTLTSVALTMAEDELGLGRPDAQSVVVVITDGKPLNKHNTKNAAHNLRKKARLMWVAVTPSAPLKDIKKWASTPVSENVFRIPDFDTLAKDETLTTIMTDACPGLNVTIDVPLGEAEGFL